MSALSRALAALVAASLAGASVAADIYRWVDDKGVTNLSDVVPEKYKKSAQKVETQVEPESASRRAAAAASGASSGSASPVASATRRGTAVPTSSVPARAASGAGSLSPTQTVDGEDCATLQRRYKESQECFGPQPRTVTGAINGARSPQCPVVVDPSPKCGLADNAEPPPAPATSP